MKTNLKRLGGVRTCHIHSPWMGLDTTEVQGPPSRPRCTSRRLGGVRTPEGGSTQQHSGVARYAPCGRFGLGVDEHALCMEQAL